MNKMAYFFLTLPTLIINIQAPRSWKMTYEYPPRVNQSITESPYSAGPSLRSFVMDEHVYCKTCTVINAHVVLTLILRVTIYSAQI